MNNRCDKKPVHIVLGIEDHIFHPTWLVLVAPVRNGRIVLKMVILIEKKQPRFPISPLAAGTSCPFSVQTKLSSAIEI